MNNPEISVIIPVYNVENYIVRCTKALMEQTFCDAEFIFVDDASPDTSIDLIRETISRYPDRVSNCRLVRHEVNRGLTAARNSGLSIAKGKYVLHADSDDWMEPNMLEVLHTEAVKYDADIVYSDFWMEMSNSTEYFATSPWHDGNSNNLASFINSPWTVVWNMLVKRELYFKNGIRSLECLSFCEDFNLSVKLLLVSGATRHIDEALYHYNRMNIGSMTHVYDRKRVISEQNAYDDVASFMEGRGDYPKYEKEMGWRFLRSKDSLLIMEEELGNYISYHPECHKYILSCPYLSSLRKVMAWCLTHNMKLCTILLIRIRKVFGK